MKESNLNLKEFNLTFSPRTITDALGSKAIELDSIVLAELIKNSMDANSKNIEVNLSDYKNTIIIKDDGDGMNFQDIEDKWSVVASDNKANNGLLGGKGIGRFSLFKLCNKFTIITKKSDFSELEFTIDANKLLNHENLEDFKIKIHTNTTPKIFTSNLTGTKIILKNMNNISIEEIYSGLKNLILENSSTENKIAISYKYPKYFKIKDSISPDKAKLSAPFHCTAEFKKNELLTYSFYVSLNNSKYVSTVKSEDFIRQFNENVPNIDLGKIKFELNVFFFGANFIKNYNIDKETIKNQFLDFYYGISVYRNDFKIYGLGKNDWLELTEERVDNPSKSVNNKQIYGFVELRSPDSDKLEEKTSREGFIRSEYLNYLKSALKLIIKQLEKDAYPYRKDLNQKNSLNLFNKPKEDPKDSSEDTSSTSAGNQPKDSSEDTSSTSVGDQPKDSSEDTPSTSVGDQPKDSSEDTSSTSAGDQPSNSSKQKPRKSPTSSSTIIDISYFVPDHSPEKFKNIIYELQKIKQDFCNAQALLLRCLIDTATDYASTALNITTPEKDLKGSILKVINYLGNNRLLDKKYLDRIRAQINKESVINYFNGIAHYYDYRPDYTTLKDVWNAFEPYISFCINQKLDK